MMLKLLGQGNNLFASNSELTNYKTDSPPTVPSRVSSVSLDCSTYMAFTRNSVHHTLNTAPITSHLFEYVFSYKVDYVVRLFKKHLPVQNTLFGGYCESSYVLN